jgi:hypothetical protein
MSEISTALHCIKNTCVVRDGILLVYFSRSQYSTLLILQPRLSCEFAIEVMSQSVSQSVSHEFNVDDQ